jgi:hypothetical protein
MKYENKRKNESNYGKYAILKPLEFERLTEKLNAIIYNSLEMKY